MAGARLGGTEEWCVMHPHDRMCWITPGNSPRLLIGRSMAMSSSKRCQHQVWIILLVILAVIAIALLFGSSWQNKVEM